MRPLTDYIYFYIKGIISYKEQNSKLQHLNTISLLNDTYKIIPNKKLQSGYNAFVTKH